MEFGITNINTLQSTNYTILVSVAERSRMMTSLR